MRPTFVALLTLMSTLSAAAQTASLVGTVTDPSHAPIPGANVVVEGTDIGVATSLSGSFALTGLAPGSYYIGISAIGFQRRVVSVRLASGETAEIAVVLSESVYDPGEVIVTALRRPEVTTLVPVSVGVLSGEQLDVRNVVSLDDALRYAPGVQVAENQISIRGSSGFSYNVGSRVLLLVDGVPMLGPEAGGIPFDLIPVPRIERIEIIKGPGSALYGSGALGGIINVITTGIPSDPEYSVRVFGGAHDPVRYAAWRSRWPEAGDMRTFGGLSLSHARPVGRSGGGWIYLSYRSDEGYLRGIRDELGQAYAKAEWSPSASLSFSVLGGVTARERDSFFYWNGLDDVLSPGNLDILSPGSDASGTNDNLSVQVSVLPSIRHLVRSHLFHTLRLRFFSLEIRPIDEFGNLRPRELGTTGYRLGGEWQLDWAWSEAGYVTAGVAADANAARSDFFRGSGGGLRFVQPELGTFVQLERSVGARLNVLAGIRFDAYRIDTTTTASRFTPKLSASYNLEEHTVLRASFGQGFRVPGIAERYINNQDFFPFFPNPRLKPERSTGYEVGMRTRLDSGNRWTAFGDLALFWSDYHHLVEPRFVTDPAAAGLSSYGFQFVNLVRARIRGAEATLEGHIGRGTRAALAHTLLDAYDLTEGRPLAFRSTHLTKVTISNNPWRGLSVSVDYRFTSRPERVDTDFAAVVSDADVMVPTHVVDARIAYEFPRIAVSVIAYNLFDYYYVERPAYLAPPRRGLVQVKIAL